MIGYPFKFDKCSEPTDIIWENRHFTRMDYFWRQLKAYTCIAVLLFGSFVLIYWISMISAEAAQVFPLNTDCDNIKAAYGANLQTYAIQDFNFVTDEANKGKQSSGCLQCFCAQEAIDNPDTYLTDDYGSGGTAICEEYAGLAFKVYLLTSALSYILIGVNYILRTICIMLVDWIGYDTETERLSQTTNVTFYVLFFNSAFLLLMVNANLSEQPFSFGLTSG